ncbi:MAG: SGNH/GDSL hydrolase family protein [Candidatus Omnitrophica bacterium]|nr:SGNH/GDSL hydrolase family protein [Candidatus Omnitrophota bacterium]MDD5671133.1 SGNH/GDSL hydrolase family protein [Candidatus Omnitrophota bacterium]
MFTRFVRNLFVSFLALVFLLLALEGIFRLARKEDALKLSMGRVDTKYHHTFMPHAVMHLTSHEPGEYDTMVHINGEGFRGPEMTVEKKPGIPRIFLVGDSFVFGVGAEDDETISVLLQEQLATAGLSTEVVNVGRGSTSPLIYYLRLREEIPKFKPDMIVMMLDFSDLWEDWNFEKNLVDDKNGEMAGLNPYYEYGHFLLWNYLRANSVFASYVHNKVVRTFLQIQKLGLRKYCQAVLEGKKVKAVIATTREDVIAYDGRLFLRGEEKAGEIRRHFERTGKYILMSARLAQQNRIPFVLVMYPYGIQVGPEQWGKGRVSWGFEEGKTYTDPFSFDLVAGFAKENGIPFVNLTEDLRRNAGQMLYFPYDGHFTPAANAIVAQSLSRQPAVLEALAAASVH